MAEKLEVGQQVWVNSMNSRGRGAERGVVTKVGRKLVTIKTSDAWWGVKQYRIDERTVNDSYGHESFMTDAEKAARETQEADISVLAGHGFKLDYSARPTDADLRLVADALRGAR